MAHAVLIAGASGLVGSAAVDKFLDDGSDVIAISRREPEVFSDKPFRHLPIDLQDGAATSEAVQGLTGVTHVVYAAVFLPALAAGAHRAPRLAAGEVSRPP